MFQADEILRLQGEVATCAYIVLSGSLSTHVRPQGIDARRKRHILSKIRAAGAIRLRMAALGTPPTVDEGKATTPNGASPVMKAVNRKGKVPSTLASVSEEDSARSDRVTSLREMAAEEPIWEVIGHCVRVMGAGAAAGEVVMLDGGLASPCSIVARETCEVLEIEGTLLRSLNMMQVRGYLGRRAVLTNPRSSCSFNR